MNFYKTGILKEEILQCDNLEDLEKEILSKLQEQRGVWQEKIEQIIKEKDYSCKEMAALCRVSETSVRKWRRGSLPQNRDMFIRIGFAAGYDVEEMNHFLQRYGHYPQLYVRSLEDSVCMFILNSKSLPHTYEMYIELLERIRTEVNGVGIQEASYSTQEIEEQLFELEDEGEMQTFVSEHAAEYRKSYQKLYNYIQAFLRINQLNPVDESRMSIQELAENQNWSSSLRHCVSEIRSGRWFPLRHKLISLGLHLNMDLEEINQMLELAQMETLCAKNPVEAVLMYALEDARLNEMIYCDGTNILSKYVKDIFLEVELEEASFILDDL